MTATPSVTSVVKFAMTLGPLQDDGRAQAALCADRDQRGVLVAADKLSQHLVHDARTRRGERVTQRDGASVHVELAAIDLAQRGAATELRGKVLRGEGLQVRGDLRREGLVHVD